MKTKYNRCLEMHASANIRNYRNIPKDKTTRSKHTELSKHTKGQNYAVNAENISK